MANEVEITITATDLTGPAFASAMAKMEALKKAAGDISFGRIDTNALGSDLMTLRSKLQSLGIADLVDINIPPGRIIQQLQFLKRMIDQSGISDIMDLNVNDASLTKQLHKISTFSETIPINFDVSRIPNLAKLFSTETIDVKRVFVGNTSGPPGILSTQNMEETFKINGLLAAEAQLAATNAQTQALADGFKNLEVAKDSFAGDVDNKLTPAVQRGGIAIGGWGGILGGTIGAVGLWHVALDLAVEGLIAVVTAAAAAAVGIAAMTPAATDIYNHLKNLNTISAALTQNIPPMSGAFSSLTDSMKPAVVEAYGGALFLLSKNTGVFSNIAHTVGGMLDNWIAKIDIWSQSQNGMQKLLNTGVGFLSQFGQIIGNVALAISNLINKDPGIAHLLFDVIDGASKALVWLTQLPGPIVEAGLAFHGFYVYGNLASGLLGNIVGAFGGADTAAGRLATTLQKGFKYGDLLGTTGALIAIGAAIAYIATSSEEANTPTARFAQTLLQNFDNASPAAALQQAGADIKQYQKDIAQAYSPQSLQEIIRYQSSVQGLGSGIKDYFVGVGSNINKVMNDIASGHYKSELSDLGHVFTGLFTNQTNESVAAGAAIKDYQAKINTVVTQSSNLRAVQLALVSSGNNWTGALDIMSQAGIKASDSYGLMIQKVNNLINGYQNLGIGAGQDAAMFNAVNYSTAQADNALGEYDKSMAAATSAEAQLFGVLIGGQSTMYSFLSAIGQMSTDAAVGGASLNSLNSQSVKLGSDLYGSVLPAAESFINAIQMQGASANILIPIIANTAGNILQLTGQNKAAKLAVVDLINGALGPGTVSMQNLDTWVGKNSVSQQQFAKDVFTSQQNASSLAGVLNKNLIPMMNQAFIQATNLAPAMKTWFTDVINGTAGTAQGQKDRANLIRDIINAGTAAHDSAGQIEGMIAQILGIPKSKAVQLYLQASGSGNITFNEKVFGNAPVTGGLAFLASGGRLPGYGGGDILPAMLEPGETVIDKQRSKDWAWMFRMMGVPGYATGGIAGLVPRISNTGMNFMTGTEASFGRSVENSFAQAAIASLKAAVAKQVQKETVVPGGVYLGPGGSSYAADITTVLRQFGMPLSLVANWLRQIQTESGGNLNAVNLTDSNARAGHPSVGLLQLIPSTFAAFSGPYRNTPPLVNYGGGPVSENAMAQIYTAIKYADIRYGGAQGMAAVIGHGHGYDSGGWLSPGWNIAYNGTGKPERVPNPNGGDGPIQLEISSAGQSAFEQFMIMAIRQWVTLKGGGNVQKAFGVSGR